MGDPFIELEQAEIIRVTSRFETRIVPKLGGQSFNLKRIRDDMIKITGINVPIYKDKNINTTEKQKPPLCCVFY